MGKIPKPFTKEQLLDAMDKTQSIKAAARYLNCSYQHLKPWMKQYVDEKSGKTLFDLHKNQSGKGIPKFISHTPFGRKKKPAILDIVEGRVDSSHFSPQKIKVKMIEAGLLEEKCYVCNFSERRVSDFKMPLIMHFKDNDSRHYNLGNVQLLCYNCFFLYYGKVFNEKDLNKLEGHGSVGVRIEKEPLQLDAYQIKKLRELGLDDSEDDEDPYSLVSYK